MKQLLITFIGITIFGFFTQLTIRETSSTRLELTKKDDVNYKKFGLFYSYFPLGINPKPMQPTFRVSGNKYTYTKEFNGYPDEPYRKPITISEGEFRVASIEAILDIVKVANDTVISKSNGEINEGGTLMMTVTYQKINWMFIIQNSPDAAAHQIINILNNNIPRDKEKLPLIEFPEDYE
jgi:hypothetical protein